ncbi:MAG: Uma2 family endonuclease [Thermomicrobiales bacterium]
MAQRTEDGLVSVEEYLEMEERSEIRHEYVGGMLYAMVGGTDRHNQIALNISATLLPSTREGPCRVNMTDMRLLIGDVYYYPDVMAVCEPPETENPIWRTNPCLVVEVLSTSSESIDWREKLLAYRGIPTVQTYLVVHQDIRRVERHFRAEDGKWHRADHVSDGVIPLPCPPEARLTLSDIYRGL